MANIIVDPPAAKGQDQKPQSQEDQLVSWVMSRVDRWREYRDNSFQARWGEYYRLWRGRWSAADKNRSSERSRLIAPALSQAIEMTVAEMEEATFGREQWFDVRDDVESVQAGKTDEAKALIVTRDRLLEDTAKAGVPDAIAGSYLNGALYGNGIGKIVVQTHTVRQITGRKPNGAPIIESQDKVQVKLDPLPADEFIPDPSATCIEEMLGCAHELLKPMSWVNRLQTRGIFRKVDIVAGDGADSQIKQIREDLEGHLTKEDTVLITEYHGLVPARLIPVKKPEGAEESVVDELINREEVKSGDETMVESIVTIANKGELLRAKKNPFWMQDRSIVSYQHEKVPGRFWGRGVAEKGFNPQKALDAELRSRMDALALISNPMMSADITRLPRGFDLRIRPGKLWLTNGAPKDVLNPVIFQGLDPSTFNQTGEMERMVQMGTGAMDSATPMNMNARNSTATGSSLQQAGFVKRSKRAMANVSRNFLQPIVSKILWRYMQFDPDRYPRDVDFRVMGTLGIVARELEQNQLTQMLGLVPEGSPPQLVLVKAIFDNSSSPYKAQVNAAVDQMMQPPSEEEQAKQQFTEQLQMAALQAGVEQTKMENQKLQSEIVLNMAKASATEGGTEAEQMKVQVEVQKLFAQLQEVRELGRQNDAALLNARANFIKANKESGGNSNNGNQS
jgi:hypothetical protein